MTKIDRFVIWICSKFIRTEIELIIKGLSDVLANRNPNVKPKDDFKQNHPHWRNFFISPLSPILYRKKPKLSLNWKDLLKKYEKEHSKPLKPVHHRNNDTAVPTQTKCRTCGAPSEYLYFNNGKKSNQVYCKICSSLNPLNPQNKEPKTKFLCPHCEGALFLWKQKVGASIYKCDNDKCNHYLENKSKLNFKEKILAKLKPSQFKLRYQYREYYFTNEQLKIPSPQKPSSSKLFNIRNSLNTLSLALTFYVSFAIPARKTALILRKVFNLPISYQTVLNYASYSSYYAHHFNLAYKDKSDNLQVADEKYIKVNGEDNYTYFYLSPTRRSISSYLVSESKDVLPAIISTQEAIRTCSDKEKITIVTDGNPSYIEATNYINMNTNLKQNLEHKKVIGLQNLDSESEEYRPFKQMIERLNRTYNYHTKQSCGFKVPQGSLTLTTLFVTHYNFLRPHHFLNYEVPIPLKEIQDIPTFQGQWAKILNMATDLVAA